MLIYQNTWIYKYLLNIRDCRMQLNQEIFFY